MTDTAKQHSIITTYVALTLVNRRSVPVITLPTQIAQLSQRGRAELRVVKKNYVSILYCFCDSQRRI